MKNTKTRKIISALVAIVMSLSLFPNLALAEGDFELVLNVYKWDSVTGQKGDKIDPATDILNVDDEILVMVGYKNLSSLSDAQAFASLSADIKYDSEYFEATFIDKENETDGTYALSDDYYNQITQYLPTAIKSPTVYNFNLTDKPADETYRYSYISVLNQANKVKDTNAVKDNECELGGFTYKAKKKTIGTETTNFSFNDDGFLTMSYFNSSGYTSATQIDGYSNMKAAGMADVTDVSIRIDAISGEAVIDEATGVTKTVDESTGKLDADSYIVVSGRTKDGGETMLPITSTTVANIYKNATAEGASELTKGEQLNTVPVAATLKDGSADEYEIKIPLSGYDDEDFIVTIITDYNDTDKQSEESKGVLVEAAKETQPPLVEKANITKVFGADGKLAAGSLIKIENLTGQTTGIKDGTVIKVYDAAENGNELTSYAATKADDGNTYLNVELTGLDDGVIYLSATENGLEESSRTAVPYLLSKAPSKVTIENNYYDNNTESNSYIKISSVKTGESDGAVLTTDIKSNTTFNLYSSVNNGSETPGALISTGITPSENTIDGVLTAVLTMDKKAMGEDGTAYWISAVEPNGENGIEYLESEKVFLSPKKAGSTIKDIIDPENPPTDPPLSDEDNQKIQDIKDQGVPKPVIVPEGTEKTSAALDEYGLNSDSKIIVYFEPAVETDDGTMTNIATIDATWNLDDMATDDGNKLIIDTPDQGHTYKTYDVSATLDENQLKAAGLKVDNSVYQPSAQIMVVKNIDLTLKNGNATETDLADTDDDGNNRFKASDVFVYYNYKFADPGFTVRNSDDTTEVDTTKLKKYIKGEMADDGVTPKYLTDEELVNKVVIDNTTELSKKITICYEYTDSMFDVLTKTVERDVYVIYKRGDVNRSGGANDLDASDIMSYGAGLFTEFGTRLNDYLYKTKTADVNENKNVNDLDASDIMSYAAGLLTLNQYYDVDESTKTMKFTTE